MQRQYLRNGVEPSEDCIMLVLSENWGKLKFCLIVRRMAGT